MEQTIDIVDELLAKVATLTARDKLRLVRRITDQLLDDLKPAAPPTDETPLTDEEIAEMLTPSGRGLTGREMYEEGLFGGWEDKGITDSVEWLQERRRARRERNKW